MLDDDQDAHDVGEDDDDNDDLTYLSNRLVPYWDTLFLSSHCIQAYLSFYYLCMDPLSINYQQILQCLFGREIVSFV